jgi:transposase
VDYAGPHVEVVDLETGQVREGQIFVAALGASHLLFAEATWTQQLPDWIASHVRMAEYYGGLTALVVPDNLKTGVTHACFYEPELNATYQDFATHYGTAILPARVAKPRDKAKVEGGVLIVEREVLAPLRHHRFTSLAQLNAAIGQRLEAVNTRPFQLLAGSRRSVFEALERATLRPLPAERYEFSEWRTAKVHIDYHVAVESHFYSVPHALLKATVRVRLTATMVEILHRGQRVAAHRRSVGAGGKGRYTTDPAHRPKSHQAHLEWTPERLIRWGCGAGPRRRRGRRAHPRAQAASGARLSELPRLALARQALHRSTARRRVCAGAGHGHAHVSVRQVHSHRGPRQAAPRGAADARAAGAPCACARRRVQPHAGGPWPSFVRSTGSRFSHSFFSLARSLMLMQQTLALLHSLRLTGMAHALEEQAGIPDIATLAFEDRFALVLEREKHACGPPPHTPPPRGSLPPRQKN